MNPVLLALLLLGLLVTHVAAFAFGIRYGIKAIPGGIDIVNAGAEQIAQAFQKSKL